MFELKPAIVYHPWHFSSVQTGQLRHIESNNEKNATLCVRVFFFLSVNQQNVCQHLLVLRAVKTRVEMSNNNYAVRGGLKKKRIHLKAICPWPLHLTVKKHSGRVTP